VKNKANKKKAADELAAFRKAADTNKGGGKGGKDKGAKGGKDKGGKGAKGGKGEKGNK
jgi:hypothetical protein